MDLRIKDVAELLNMSQATIVQWVKEGSIPYYRIGDEYFFSRMEIENLLLRKKIGVSSFSASYDDGEVSSGNKQFNFYRAIHKGGVLHKVPGETKEAVIRNAMKIIAKDFDLDADVLTDLLLDRENLQPTALSNGIGLPHTREAFINSHNDRVIIAFPEEPIKDYGALDGKPVHTLLFLFACDDKRHLHLLAKIAHLASKPETITFLESKPNKSSILEYVKEWEGNIGKMTANR